jgi:lysophospholipase L1-like esterase
MAAFENDGVVMASTDARSWTTDADVQAYFEKTPVEDMYGKLQNGSTHKSPTTVRNGISADGVHFNQVGYNI